MTVASTAGKVELSRRRENVSFAHHAEVAGLEPLMSGNQNASKNESPTVGGSFSDDDLAAQAGSNGPG